MSLIKITNMTKSFKGNSLFENANVTFEKNRIYGIQGPNGSGKSVLLKMICGFVKPDAGEVYINPEYLGKRQDFPQSFGIIIDRPGYLSGYTGFDNLRRLADIQNRIGDEQIRNTMRLVGLDPDARQKMKSYSLGMKQKVALAQAIMENQDVLILDEPFNALDVESVAQVRQLLQQYKKEGKTIVLTSHNQEDIDLLCDEVFLINGRKINKI